MPAVTVRSAHSTTVSLSYDSSANASLAQFVASAIQTGINGNTVVPFAGNTAPAPAIPAGRTGERVQNALDSVILGHGRDYIVDASSTANITGSADADVQMLVGSGNLIFNASGDSSSVIAGGGNNQVIIPAPGPGA